jgi:hypothetical protein
MSDTTINLDMTKDAVIYVDVIAGGCGGGGGGGTGESVNEVWLGPAAPTDDAVELWVDTDEARQAAPPARRRRYQRSAPQRRASQPATVDQLAALMARVDALEQRLAVVGG